MHQVLPFCNNDMLEKLNLFFVVCLSFRYGSFSRYYFGLWVFFNLAEHFLCVLQEAVTCGHITSVDCIARNIRDFCASCQVWYWLKRMIHIDVITLNPVCPRRSPRTVYSPFPKWERLQLALRCQWWNFKDRYITWNHLKFLEHQTCWKLFNVNHITSINNTISCCRYLYVVFVNTCIFMQFIFWESLKSVIEFFIMLAFISLMVSS